MKKFRKIWDEDKNAFVRRTKGLTPRDAYATFLAAYPECEGDVTLTAFLNQRSMLGAAGKPTHNFCRKPRPIGAEQVKKGYVRIKVGQPNVWMIKAKWVYMQTHPNEDLSERSNYIFLDGDTRNFDPENIERVPPRCMGLFNLMGGCERGRPELTRVRLAQAKLKLASLDLGEKLGLTSNLGSGRRFREDVNGYAESYRNRPEVRERIRKRSKERWQALKKDPAKLAEWYESQRKYSREWARRHRKAKKEMDNGKSV